MNNTSSAVEESPDTITFSTTIQVTLIVILGVAFPLGLFMELYLILKLLIKGGRRLWDILTLALEE